ncbi:carboxymuconolactone decarboxylase family protein [Caballeronia sp. LZ008]|uniref:carboxymuconolactone decarboxylase family protein n=1 Tax=unclassified Caballeronia TaxID=2646786 RepID=UPI00202884F0|nr:MULTISPECIES: carboxymuconolactone decarboxylase family protein [unclassified Caballeronia]MDR5798180.1 carboxymuconolactone decarboxylase family protein [Caballeronia sp. LZ008]
MQRFEPLTPDAMTPEQSAVAEQLSSGPRGGVRGPFLVLLHHPELARVVQALGEHLRFGTDFPDSLIEIGVLVTARHWTCQYEWVAHSALAKKAGVSEAIISAIAEDRVPQFDSADEALVHRFCVETNTLGQPSDEAYEQARKLFGARGVLDLLSLCGYYSMLAMVLNTARLPLPAGQSDPLAPRAT